MPNLGANWDFITPTLINEATFGMNLWTEDQIPSKSALGLLSAMSVGGVAGAASVTYDGRFPMVDDSTAYTLTDRLSKGWGSHLFKMGVKYQHTLYNQHQQAGGNGFAGNFSFGTDSNNPNDSGYAYANAMLGLFDTYSEATNRAGPARILTKDSYPR